MIFYEDFKTGTLTPVYGYGSSLRAAEWNAEPGRKTKTKRKEPPLLRLLLRASSSSLCSYALIEDVEGGEEDFSDFDFDDFDDDSDGGTGGGGRVKVMMSKPEEKKKKKVPTPKKTSTQRVQALREREKMAKKRIRDRSADNMREKREKNPGEAAEADKGRSRKAAWRSGWRTPEQLEKEKQKEEPKKRKRGMEDQKTTKKPRGA